MEDDLLEFSYRQPEKPVRGDEMPLYWHDRNVKIPVSPAVKRAVQIHRTKRNLTLDDLELSVRASTILEDAGVVTVGELLAYNADELLEFRNFGETSLREVKQKLAMYGLKLKE